MLEYLRARSDSSARTQFEGVLDETGATSPWVETGLLVLGNYFPTGDLDRLVKKDGPGKLNRRGNLHGLSQNVLRGLTTITISSLEHVPFKRNSCGHRYLEKQEALLRTPWRERNENRGPWVPCFLVKANGSIDYAGMERLLPNQRQARQEPRSPIETLGR